MDTLNLISSRISNALPSYNETSKMSGTVKIHRVTQSLVNLIGANNWEHRFRKAITSARDTGVEELQKIKTLDDFYRYLDAFLFWVPSEDRSGYKVYQELCAYHFILAQPSVLGLQSTILPSTETRAELSELSQWMVMFSNTIGVFLDEPRKSLTEKTFKTFEDTPDTYPDGRPGYRVENYKLPEGATKDSKWWDFSFNDFFTREFKNIDEQRPVGNPEDPYIIANGADSSFDGYWHIEDDATVAFDYQNAEQVTIKTLPYNISQLLDGSQYSNHFAGGTFMHAFLGPADYHRQHSPVDGEILEAKVVPGNVYLEVFIKKEQYKAPTLAPRRPLNPIPIPKLGRDGNYTGETGLDAPDYPGYQFSQARGLITIKTEALGLVAFLPIGMSHVSSVVLHPEVKVGAKVKKGQELSKFMFGGSDYIMCFQKGVELDFKTFDITRNKWCAVRSAYIKAKTNSDFKKPLV